MMLDEIVLRRTDCQHRAGGFRDDFFGCGPKKSARKTTTAMGYDCDQIDVIISHSRCDFSGGLALNDYWFDFQSIEHRIGQKLLDFSAQLPQPLCVLILKDALR